MNIFDMLIVTIIFLLTLSHAKYQSRTQHPHRFSLSLTKSHNVLFLTHTSTLLHSCRNWQFCQATENQQSTRSATLHWLSHLTLSQSRLSVSGSPRPRYRSGQSDTSCTQDRLCLLSESWYCRCTDELWSISPQDKTHDYWKLKLTEWVCFSVGSWRKADTWRSCRWITRWTLSWGVEADSWGVRFVGWTRTFIWFIFLSGGRTRFWFWVHGWFGFVRPFFWKLLLLRYSPVMMI